MKLHFSKTLFTFIMTIMMFSLLPGLGNAQPSCHNGACPAGYVCVNGHCQHIVFCNCAKRPIPFECGQICGFYADPNHTDDMLSLADPNPAVISLELIESQNVSLKIFDLTGRMIKTGSDISLSSGEHQIEWNKTDDEGYAVNAGVYIVQIDAGAEYPGTKKLLVIN